MLKKYKISTVIVATLLVLFMIVNYDLHIKKIPYFYKSEEFDYLENFTFIDIEEVTRDVNITRFWFMENGNVWPNKSTDPTSTHLFPDPTNPYDDRIPKQLMYVPQDYGDHSQYKTLLQYHYIGSWIPHEEGSIAFKKCPVNRCNLTNNKNLLDVADAVMFGGYEDNPNQPMRQNKNQIWIYYALENPIYTSGHYSPSDIFNWTITYRPDSDIPNPYGRWFDYGLKIDQINRNYAANKTKKVAWFVSNCKPANNRYEYAKELQKYIEVDIFGKCGDKTCPRKNKKLCNQLLAQKYKFYLAFENGNCNYYITEKFYENALRHRVIPIVMGARHGDYAHLAPKGSYIDISEFSSPLKLAEYLHELDQNDKLYNEYFKWRGTGEFIKTHLYCRICALLHSKYPVKYYKDINYWYKGNQACSYP